MNQAFQTGFPHQPQNYQQFYTNPSQSSLPGITKAEIKLYQEGFKNICGERGHLSGKEGRDILMKSQLPVTTLRKIWELSDPLATGMMKEEQFIIAMHIIANVRSKGCEVPDVLPDSLKRLIYKNEESSPLTPPPPIKEKPKPEKPPSPKPAPKVIEFTFPSMDQFSTNPTPNPSLQLQPKIQKHSKTNSLKSYEDAPLSEEVSKPKDYMIADELKKIIKEKETMINSKKDWLGNLNNMIEDGKNELDLFKQKNKQLEMKIRENEESHSKMHNELANAKIKFEDNIKKKDNELNEIKYQLAQQQEINKQLMERKTVSQLKEQYENYAARQEIKVEKPKFENKPENVVMEKKVEAFNFNPPNEKINFSQKDNMNTIEAKNEPFEFYPKARSEVEVKEIQQSKVAIVETKPIKPDFQFEFSTSESKIESSALSFPSIEKFDFEVKASNKDDKVLQKQVITSEIKNIDKKTESPQLERKSDEFNSFPEISNKKSEVPMFDFKPQPIAVENKSIKPLQSDKKIEQNSFKFDPPKPISQSEGFGFDFTNTQKIENKITPMFDFNMEVKNLENKKPAPAKEGSIFDFPKDALVQKISPAIEKPKSDIDPTIELKSNSQKNEVQFSFDSKPPIDQFSQLKNEFDLSDKNKDIQPSSKLPTQNFGFDMPKEIKSDKDSKSSSPTIRSESPESSFKSEPATSSTFSLDIQKSKDITMDPFNFSPPKPPEQFKFSSEPPKPPMNEFQYPPQIKAATNINSSAKEKELNLDSSSSSSESLEYENEKADFDFDLKPEDIPQPKMEFGFGNDTPKQNVQPKSEFNFNQAPNSQPALGFDFNKGQSKPEISQPPKDIAQSKMEFDFNKEAPKVEIFQASISNPQPKMEFNFNENLPKGDSNLASKENPQPKMDFNFNKEVPKAPQFDFNKGFAQPPQFDFNKGVSQSNIQPKAEFEFGKEISQPKAEKNPSFSFEFKPDDIKFDPQFDKFNGQGFDFQSASIANAFKGDLFKIETSAIKPRKSPTDLEFD